MKKEICVISVKGFLLHYTMVGALVVALPATVLRMEKDTEYRIQETGVVYSAVKKEICVISVICPTLLKLRRTQTLRSPKGAK